MQPELTNLLTLERQSPLATGDCSVNLTLLDLTSMIIICLFNELRYLFSVPVFQKVVCVRGINTLLFVVYLGLHLMELHFLREGVFEVCVFEVGVSNTPSIKKCNSIRCKTCPFINNKILFTLKNTG